MKQVIIDFASEELNDYIIGQLTSAVMSKGVNGDRQEFVYNVYIVIIDHAKKLVTIADDLNPAPSREATMPIDEFMELLRKAKTKP